MKTGIHPTYHKDAKVTCVCGAVFVAGSTVEKIQVELCSNCHPFYTGKQKLVDTAGRVEKFEAKRKAAESKKMTVEKVEEELEENTVDIKPKSEKKLKKAAKKAGKTETA